MLRSFAKIPTGGFSVLLSAAVLLMVGGLIASDRALTRDSQNQAQVDAAQTSIALARVIRDELRSGATPNEVAKDSLVNWILSRGPSERDAAALVAGRD